jgi:hypothetical protein
LFADVLKKFWTSRTENENKALTRRTEEAPAMTRIADILTRSRDTIVADALGVLALAGFTLGMLHLPGLI